MFWEMGTSGVLPPVGQQWVRRRVEALDDTTVVRVLSQNEAPEDEGAASNAGETTSCSLPFASRRHHFGKWCTR